MRELEADDQGRYNIVSVPASTYDMVVTAAGFQTLSRTGIKVTINNGTRVAARLDIGQVSEQVRVSASSAALQADRSDTRTEISSNTVVELPLPSYRNFQSMINLVPGATPARFRTQWAHRRSVRLLPTPTALTGTTTIPVWTVPSTFTSGCRTTLSTVPASSRWTDNISTSSVDAEQGMAALLSRYLRIRYQHASRLGVLVSG